MGWLDWVNPFDIGGALAETIFALATIVIYPILRIAGPILTFLETIFNSIVNIVNFFFWIFDFLWNSIMWTLSALFPTHTASILGIILCEVIALGIIKKVGGIEILGFSIGKGG